MDSRVLPQPPLFSTKFLYFFSETATPQLHYTAAPRTEYKPDLKILKRPQQSPSPQPVIPVLSKQEEEALRIERAKKYEETKERIWGTPSPGPNTSAPTEKKVWEPKEGKEKGVLPIRGPRGPNEGKGFARGRGRGDS